MKIAIMQPYFFPYIGYFNLINACENFIFYDDVNFIKNGWINRNRVLTFGNVKYITVPIENTSSFIKIKDTYIKKDMPWQNKILSCLSQSYKGAAFYAPSMEIIENVLKTSTTNISTLAANSVKICAEYIGIQAKFSFASECFENQHLHGEERIIDICLQENAEEYFNLPGGRNLYDKNNFKNKNITLTFIQPKIWEYNHFTPLFEPALSIIDVMMHNSPEKIRESMTTKSITN